MPDYELRVLPLTPEPTPEAAIWAEVMGNGFHEGKPSDERIAQWWADTLVDQPRIVGVYLDRTLPYALPATHPVGTIATLTRTINTGAGHLEPACFVTDVTVRATHRRRGLLRLMMAEALDTAIADGLAFATLTASEGGIYRRFGFGVAIDAISVEIDASRRFVIAGRPHGIVELAHPADLVELRRELFTDFHARQVGSHDRLAYYDARLSGSFDYETPPVADQLRAAVHYDPSGTPDGVATWLDKGWGKPLQVIELLANDEAATLDLWRLLVSIDGIDRIECSNLNPASPLPAAFDDPRAIKQTGRGDHIWLRILDVARALSVRPWATDIDLVLGVQDPLGLSGGQWRLRTAQGSAQVTPTDAAPAVELDIDVLGSVYFGGRTLRDFTPNLVGDARAIRQLDAALRPAELPWCTTYF